MATDSQFAALFAIEEAGWAREHDLDIPSPTSRLAPDAQAGGARWQVD